MTLATACSLTVLALQTFGTNAFSSGMPVVRLRNLSPYPGLQTHRLQQELIHNRNYVSYMSTSDESGNLQDESDSGMEDEDNYMGSNQYDEYEMAGQPQDAEMIEAMRLERIIANDRWQSCLIRDKQGGEWTGQQSAWMITA